VAAAWRSCAIAACSVGRLAAVRCTPPSGIATSPGAQAALDQLHHFHRRCAMGQEELIEATQLTEVNLFNYYQDVNSVEGDMKVMGYACVTKKGCRAPKWSGEAEWAHEVLHAANLQTEWSEQNVAIRRVVGRMAAVVRMPFSAPGVAAAAAALPNIPQSRTLVFFVVTFSLLLLPPMIYIRRVNTLKLKIINSTVDHKPSCHNVASSM